MSQLAFGSSIPATSDLRFRPWGSPPNSGTGDRTDRPVSGVFARLKEAFAWLVVTRHLGRSPGTWRSPHILELTGAEGRVELAGKEPVPRQKGRRLGMGSHSKFWEARISIYRFQSSSHVNHLSPSRAFAILGLQVLCRAKALVRSSGDIVRRQTPSVVCPASELSIHLDSDAAAQCLDGHTRAVTTPR